MSISDITGVLIWFFVFLFIGPAFLPLTFSLFKKLKDKGYIFSKIIGLGIISYFVLLVSTLKIAKFSELLVLAAVIIFLLINYGAFI